MSTNSAAAPPSIEQMRKAACRYLGAGYAIKDPRDRLDACAEHLAVTFSLGPEAAADLTLAAWAELEGRKSRATFDLAASTPWLMVIDDPVSGQRIPVSVGDLLRLVGPREVAPPPADAG